MTLYQADMYRMREFPTHAEHVKENLMELRKHLKKFEDARKKFEDMHILTFQEYLRSVQHIHRGVSGHERERLEKQYKDYADMTSRRKEELRTQLEQMRRNVQEHLRSMETHVNKAYNELDHFSRRIRQIREAHKQIKQEVQISAAQLTLERLNHIDHLVTRTDWMKDEAL